MLLRAATAKGDKTDAASMQAMWLLGSAKQDSEDLERCTSARHLMHAIKECKRWEKLFHLVQAHSPPNGSTIADGSAIPSTSKLQEAPSLSSIHQLTPSATPDINSLHCTPATSTMQQQPLQGEGRSGEELAQELGTAQPHSLNLEAPIINHIHLAATLTHLAQLGADPSSDARLQTWCMSLLGQVVQPPQLQAMSIRQVANILWACARLGMHGAVQGQYRQGSGARRAQRPLPPVVTGAGARAAGGVRAWGGGRHTGVQARSWQALLAAHGQRVQEALGQEAQHSTQQWAASQSSQDLGRAAPPQRQQEGANPAESHHTQQPQPALPPSHLTMQDMVNVVYACALAGQDPGEKWMGLAFQASQPLLPQVRVWHDMLCSLTARICAPVYCDILCLNCLCTRLCFCPLQRAANRTDTQKQCKENMRKPHLRLLLFVGTDGSASTPKGQTFEL